VSVALGTQLATLMCLIVIFGLSAVPHFFTSTRKQHDFREKVIDGKMCVMIFSKACVRNISHSEMNSARYYHKHT